MAVRLVVRQLPSTAATAEDLDKYLEQVDLSRKTDRIVFQRILKGKTATSTKPEVFSTAFVTVPNVQAASRVVKRLSAVKDPALQCELAVVQRVTDKLIAKNAEKEPQQAGTWTADPMYAMFEETCKPKPKVTAAAAPAPGGQTDTSVPTDVPKEKPKEVSALVAHMQKELLQRRNSKQKAQKDKRKRKAAGGSATASSSAPKSTPPSAEGSAPQAQKPKAKRPPRPKKTQNGGEDKAEGGERKKPNPKGNKKPSGSGANAT